MLTKTKKANTDSSNSKMHNAGVRVLNLLKLLVQNDISINNIMQNMRETFDDIEAPETILKYLATLEFSGFKIKKVNKKYSLCNSPTIINFSEDDFKLMEKMYRAFDNSCLSSEKQEFKAFFEFLKKSVNEKDKPKITFSDNTQDELAESKLSNKAQKYQEYVDLAQKLKLSYKGKIYTVEAKSVEIENGKTYLNVYCFVKMSIMKLLVDDIEKLEILPTKSNSMNITDSVVFEVYDNLAGNYRLRDYERIQSFSDNVKIIVNSGEDKELLLKRLMKYGENCKIISPKSFQNEFLHRLEKMKKKIQVIKK